MWVYALLFPSLLKAKSGKLGMDLVHLAFYPSVRVSILMHSSMMAGWIFFILGTVIRYHGLLIHVK